MSEAVQENKTKAAPNKEQWRQRITEQERSGLSVRCFCRERGIADHLFYYWRKRLRGKRQAVRFALVERGAAPPDSGAQAELELVLATGERLRIGAGVDAGTLRTVLQALRA
jgi:transposase-like protein